jgi:hypothetical protein
VLLKFEGCFEQAVDRGMFAATPFSLSLIPLRQASQHEREVLSSKVGEGSHATYGQKEEFKAWLIPFLQ